MDRKLMCWDIQGHHKVVIPREKCFSLISQVHEAVGHRAIFSTLSNLREHFWWPMLDEDVKWFVSTCHPCQTWQTHHLHLPPTVPNIPIPFAISSPFDLSGGVQGFLGHGFLFHLPGRRFLLWLLPLRCFLQGTLH